MIFFSSRPRAALRVSPRARARPSRAEARARSSKNPFGKTDDGCAANRIPLEIVNVDMRARDVNKRTIQSRDYANARRGENALGRFQNCVTIPWSLERTARRCVCVCVRFDRKRKKGASGEPYFSTDLSPGGHGHILVGAHQSRARTA